MWLTFAIVAAVSGSTLVSLPAFGQEDTMSEVDLRIDTSPAFIETMDPNGAQLSLFANYSLLHSHPVLVNQGRGAEFSCGYTHETPTRSSDPGSIGAKSNSEETFAAYVLQLPAKRWSRVVLVGALIPDPRTGVVATTQTRRGYRFSVSGDFNLAHRTFSRTEHRGTFYNSAAFNMYGLNRLDRFTNRDEPAVVFGYKF